MKTIVMLVAVAAALLLVIAGTAMAIGPRRLSSPTPQDSNGSAWSEGQYPDMTVRRSQQSGFGIGIEMGLRR